MGNKSSACSIAATLPTHVCACLVPVLCGPTYGAEVNVDHVGLNIINHLDTKLAETSCQKLRVLVIFLKSFRHLCQGYQARCGDDACLPHSATQHLPVFPRPIHNIFGTYYQRAYWR